MHSHHELLIELTKREIKQRYKQSLLGYAWVILNPLAQMLALSFVFSRILAVGAIGVPYSIFLYVGLLPWTFLSTSLITSANTLVLNGKLLTKVSLPRAVFIQSTILAKLVDFLLASTLLMFLFAYFQVGISFLSLWFVPLFALQILFTYGLALLIAALNVFYRDIQYLLNFILMIWMYITPIIYPPTFFDEKYQWIFNLNPMAFMITAYRQVLFEKTSPDLGKLGLCILLSVITYVIGSTVFRKLQGRFADVI